MKLLLFVCVLAATLLTAAAAPKTVCRALALSGGGNRGAYEAGAIQGLVANLPPEEVQWDVVTGISAGSINTAGIGIFAKGDEVNMAQFLVNTSSTLVESDVFQQWPGGMLEGLLKRGGLLDNSPLLSFIQTFVSRGLKDRKLLVGAVDMNTGELGLWNETDPDFATGVFASAAIPGAFQYVSARGTNYCDGGVQFGINVFGAITRCLEIVDDPADVIVDTISCESFNLSQVATTNYTTIPAFLRDVTIAVHNSQVSALADAYEAYPTVNFRYAISPTWLVAPGSSELDFNHTVLMELVQWGINDAVGAIHNKMVQPIPAVEA